MIGRTLAHYEITSELGKGGMGEVWRARDTKLGRLLVIKEDGTSNPDGGSSLVVVFDWFEELNRLVPTR